MRLYVLLVFVAGALSIFLPLDTLSLVVGFLLGSAVQIWLVPRIRRRYDR